MAFADSYLNRHNLIIPRIKEPPRGLLHFIVVIPAYLEDNIELTLNSLLEAKQPAFDVEVLVVVNYSITDVPGNKLRSGELFRKLEVWCSKHSGASLKFFALLAADLPHKHAGAGLARKIGMDEAICRFNRLNRPDGMILSLDADTPVDRNYFVSLQKKRVEEEDAGGFIYQFAHPLAGREYQAEIYRAIGLYELHLRYYRHALEFTGFPYANYTIGSCFAVKAGLYVQQGGMNRRQAGEDFYFLNKLFPHAKFPAILDACVYPSPRISERVPFGTGPEVRKIVETGAFATYSPEAFLFLKALFGRVPEMFHAKSARLELIMKDLPGQLPHFLTERKFPEKIAEINRNTASIQTFIKRFYQWFDAFMVVKYLNHLHTNGRSKVPVLMAANKLLAHAGIQEPYQNTEACLDYFREFDRQGKRLTIQE
jgi:hypothetical protein